MAKYVSDSNLQKVLQSTKKYVDDKFVDTVITNSLSISRKADTTIGQYSVALGFDNTASGNYSFAEGHLSIASGLSSHAEGTMTEANGLSAHAEGEGTIANGANQHVQGKYNLGDSTVTADNVYGTYAHIVGNGNQEVRSNAYTLDWNGNGWFAGTISIGTDNKELSTKEYVDTQTTIVDTDLNTALTGIFGSEYSIL